MYVAMNYLKSILLFHYSPFLNPNPLRWAKDHFFSDTPLTGSTSHPAVNCGLRSLSQVRLTTSNLWEVGTCVARKTSLGTFPGPIVLLLIPHWPTVFLLPFQPKSGLNLLKLWLALKRMVDKRAEVRNTIRAKQSLALTVMTKTICLGIRRP